MQKIGQAIAIQNGKEGREGLAEHAAQPAGGRDGAGAIGEARHQGQVFLGLPDHLTHDDFLRRPRKPKPAPAAAAGLYETELSEAMGDLSLVNGHSAARGAPTDYRHKSLSEGSLLHADRGS
jgi:hypothetical protein